MSALPDAPAAVRGITKTLEDAGYETWAVGGAVRDAIRGRASGDWDIATRATPTHVRKLFRRTVPIGVEHGTVGVFGRDGIMYEVTTFRRDVETDGRHAVVEFADSFDEDLARRDFTVNAIGWHPLDERLHDPFDGVGDLQRRILRTVGRPEERFREDYLRILRAFRFAGSFDLEIEEETWAAMTGLVGHLTSLSPERVRDELLKVLDSDRRPSRALTLYADSGALAVLYPELAALRPGQTKSSADTWSGTLATLDALPMGRAHLRLAGLLQPLEPDDAAAILIRLRLSNAKTDEIARIAQAKSLPSSSATPADVRRWLSRHGPARVNPAARLSLAAARAGVVDVGWAPEEVVEAWRNLRAVRRDEPPLEISDLALDGRGLMRLGLKPGPEFGAILEELLEWVLDDPTRNEIDLLEGRVRELSKPGKSA